MKRMKTCRTCAVRSTEAELTMSRHLCLLFATFTIVHISTVFPAFRDELTLAIGRHARVWSLSAHAATPSSSLPHPSSSPIAHYSLYPSRTRMTFAAAPAYSYPYAVVLVVSALYSPLMFSLRIESPHTRFVCLSDEPPSALLIRRTSYSFLLLSTMSHDLFCYYSRIFA